ncbi:MAG: BrnT family toxin [Aestuariivirgaceae bacterium]
MSDGEAEPGPPIDFDPEKDQENRIKHGISLRRAADMVLLSPPLVDDRFAYGEV